MLRSSQAHPVQQWLDAQPERQRLAVIRYASVETSPVLSFLYASLQGLPYPIDIWEDWLQLRFERISNARLMEDEAGRLEKDLAAVRMYCSGDARRIAEFATKISYLTKELRGYLAERDKAATVLDRKALLLAGVEQAGKALRKIFGKQPAVWEAIEAALDAAWLEIEEKNSLS